jgi:hypothetical protein
MRFHGGDVQRLGHGSGTTHVYGGNVTEFLIASYGGVINLFGTALKRSDIRVVGTLLNQDPINVRLLDYGGQVNFHIVPEPSTIILTAISTLAVLTSALCMKSRCASLRSP